MDLRRGSVDQLTNSQSHDQVNPTEVCWCRGASNLREVKWVQDLMVLLRSSVREEVEDGIKRLVVPYLPSQQTLNLPPRSPANLAESFESSSLQLQFVGTLPDTLLTFKNIQVEDASALRVELQDSTGSRVEVGPESSAKIQIVALDGDFEVDGRDHWTEEEFYKNVLSPRKGKPPLLVGQCEISLSKGVVIVSNISFTDNSKWRKSGKFRLGAQIIKGFPPGIVIREAVSRAFKVKERRTESFQKHETPILEDEMWRLVNIAKNGKYHQRLAVKNIHTLKDFLQLYHTNAKKLQEILHVPEKKWLEILKNAESCLLTSEQYRYYDGARGVELILDCVFNIVSVTFMGQDSQPYGALDDSCKDFVNKLREFAYEKRSELETCVPTNQALVQPQLLCPSGISWTNMLCTGTQGTYQGEQVVQLNSYVASLPPCTLRYAGGHQPEAPIGYFSDSDWINEIPNLVTTPEDRGNHFEALEDDYVTSKLRAVCCVTKAAVMFMISIQQDSTNPKKKQKVR